MIRSMLSNKLEELLIFLISYENCSETILEAFNKYNIYKIVTKSLLKYKERR